MTQADRHYNLHGLVHIRVPDCPSALAKLLDSRLPVLDSTIADIGRPSTIVLRPVRRIEGRPVDRGALRDLFGVDLYETADGITCAWGARGAQPRPGLSLSPGADAVLAYVPDRYRPGQLWGALLFAIDLALRFNDAMLCHGAVLRGQGQGLLLAGHHGVGKTRLLIDMLRSGWDFLSEDKFILHDGQALSFDPHITLRSHHRQWIDCGKPRLSDRLRAYLWSAVGHHLPRNMRAPLRRRLDPHICVTPQFVRPDCQTLTRISIEQVVLLRTSENGADPCPATDAVTGTFGWLQDMAFHEHLRLEHLLRYYGAGLPAERAALLGKHLYQQRACWINPAILSDNTSLETLKKCLVPA